MRRGRLVSVHGGLAAGEGRSALRAHVFRGLLAVVENQGVAVVEAGGASG